MKITLILKLELFYVKFNVFGISYRSLKYVCLYLCVSVCVCIFVCYVYVYLYFLGGKGIKELRAKQRIVDELTCGLGLVLHF